MDSNGNTPGGSGNISEAQERHNEFWPKQMENIRGMKNNDFKTQELPLARIKKIMKLDEDVKVREDFVVFSNIVIDDVVADPSEIITCDRDIEIPIECNMNKDGFGSISFDPDSSKIVFEEEAFGNFSFELSLCTDQDYHIPYPPSAYPVTVGVGDMLYFGAEVSAEPGLELFVKTCVATPTASPYSKPQYYFLQDGCAKDPTLKFLSTSDPMTQHFELEAFAFVDLKTSVFVHCYLMVCDQTDPSSRCALGCLSPINKRDVSMRETGSGSKSYVMSKGPLNIETKTTNIIDGMNSEQQYSSMLAYVVGSLGLVILAMLVMIGIMFKKIQSVPNGYTRVDTDINE